MVRHLTIAAAAVLSACTVRMSSEDDGLARLTAWMTGSFSSAEHAAKDPEFRDIRLRMVRIFRERNDGVWLYVEQAVARMEDKPYRQRVYRLARVGADVYESKVFELEDPAKFAGAWRDPTPFLALTPADLVDRPGCEILLRDRGDRFEGSTLGSLCGSDYRGASYATSEALITETRLLSLDRGYDAAGRQVWGSEKGAYQFVKVEDYPD